MPTSDAGLLTIDALGRDAEAEPTLARIGRWWTPSRRQALLALLLIAPVPAVSALIVMLVPGVKGEPLGRALYFGAKAWVVVLPVAWLLLADRGRISFSPARRGGIGVGAALGAAMFIVIMVVYWVLGRMWIDPETVHAAAGRKGLDSAGLYLLSACGLTLVNSLLEEYIWRWFVFRKCQAIVGSVGAVFLASSLFTLHHVVSLRAHAGWDVTVLGSVGCFIGGSIWSWLYLRYRSIWPAYISHIIADVAIFIIGWLLIFHST